jgi:hypothetical protein
MALQGSGPIRFSQIANEFGVPTSNRFGLYRVSESVGSLNNLPLDTGISQSGTIRFSDFYSKKLNVIVDCYSGSAEFRTNARAKYNNGNLRVIGGFRGAPANTSGIKVFININKTFGSTSGSVSNVALRTGSWDSGTTLQLDVGSSGQIFGVGGKGGDANGGAGGDGTSALGIEYSGATLINNGYIQSGYGGGGGGGNASNDPDKNQQDAGSSGGGGGGGAGYSIGTKGFTTDSGVYGFGSKGTDGNDSTATVRGLGGPGGSSSGAAAGAGGAGGDPSNAAQKGGDGSGNVTSGSGGPAGSNGNGIIVTSGSGSVTISGSGTLHGTIQYNGSVT